MQDIYFLSHAEFTVGTFSSQVSRLSFEIKNALRFILASLVLMFHLPQLCKNQGLPYFNEFPIFERGSEAVRMFFSLKNMIQFFYLVLTHAGLGPPHCLQCVRLPN